MSSGGGTPTAAMGGMTPQGQQVGAYRFQILFFWEC